MATKKYTIQMGDGQEATIEVEGGWATEDTLDAIAQKLKAKVDVFSTTAKSVKDTLDPKKSGSFTHSLNVAEKEVEEFEQGLTKTQKGLAVLSGALGATKDLASGVLTSTGKLTDINPIVDNVSGRLTKLAKTFGGFTDIIDLGQVAEGFAGLTADVVTLSTTISQRVLDTFDTLTQKGVQVGFNFENLGSELAEARITQEDFIKALSGANQGFMAFGGDLETGAQKFLDTVQIANTDFRDANRALGLSASETADFIARFIEDQKLGLLQNNISERELAATSFRLNRNLAVLAELTGKDVDQLREEMLTNQMAAGAQIALAKAERDGAKGLVVAFESVRAGLPEVLKPFVDQSVKFDAAIGDLAPLNVFGNVIQDLNRDLDNLRLTSMSQEERELEAVRIVERTYKNLANVVDGNASSLAEFAGVIPSDVLEQFAAAIKAGIKEQARDQRLPQGTDRIEFFLSQIDATIDAIEGGVGVIGTFADAAEEIEKTTAEFTKRIFDMSMEFLPNVVAIIADFYEKLGDNVFNQDIVGQATNPFLEMSRSFDDFLLSPLIGSRSGLGLDDGLLQLFGVPRQQARDFFGPDSYIDRFFSPAPGRTIFNRQFGGGTMPGTSYIVGEAGPELLTMGRSSGSVTTNAEMGAMAAGADTRLANALSNTTLTTESPEMQRELQNLNRNLKRLLPQALTSNGVY
jgi:hypothetical protein